MKLFLIIVFIHIRFDPSAQSNNQFLECFDGQNLDGPSLTVNSTILDLKASIYGFDDMISSCRAHGFFVLYEDYAYNMGASEVGVFDKPLSYRPFKNLSSRKTLGPSL